MRCKISHEILQFLKNKFQETLRWYIFSTLTGVSIGRCSPSGERWTWHALSPARSPDRGHSDCSVKCYAVP